MQIRLTVLGPRSAHPGRSGHPTAAHAPVCAVDVLVTAPVGTALASVASGLATAVAAAGSEAGAGGGGAGGGTVVLYAGTERLDPQRCALGEPPLVDGAVLSLHAPADPDRSPAYAGSPGLPEAAVAEAAVHLDVVAGPDAGGVHLLHGGQVRVGRSADADVPLDDPDVSRLHCAVTVAEDGRVTVADLGSTNGTAADGAPVGTHPVPLTPGALLRIGESALRLRTPGAAPSAPPRLPAHPDGEGHLRIAPRPDTGALGHAEGPWTGVPYGGATHSAEGSWTPPTRHPGMGWVPVTDGDGGGRGGEHDVRHTTHEPGPPARRDERHAHPGEPGWGSGAPAGGSGRSADGPSPGAHRGHGSATYDGPTARDGASYGASHGSASYDETGSRPGRDGRSEAEAGRAGGSGSGREGGGSRPAGGRLDGTHAHPRAYTFDVPGAQPRRRGIGAWVRQFAAGKGERAEERDDGDARGAAERAAAEAEALQLRWPDPAAVLMTALGPGPRLWERGPDHPDALTVRLGSADRLTAEGGLLPAAPVTIPLRQAGSLGLAGPRARLAGLARSVVAQLAALHSPSALEIVLISTDRARTVEQRLAEWSWLGWLPQVRPLRGQDCRLLLAYDTEQAAARAAELARRLEDGPLGPSWATAPPAAVASAAARHSGPYTVVLVDGDPGPASLRETLANLATGGQAAGIHLVCLAEAPAASPASPLPRSYETARSTSTAFAACGVAALLSGDVATGLQIVHRDDIHQPIGGDPFGTRGPTGSAGSTTAVTVDAVSGAWAERFARALAPLRLAASAQGGTDGPGRLPTTPLPDKARLLDELGLARATPASLLARWAAAADEVPAGGRAQAVLGAGPHGPLAVDLAADGPHLAVDGAAGTGKTELLRSLAASLAAAERPDRLELVLVDGAGAGSGGGGGTGGGGEGLRVCTDLPHVSTYLAASDPVRMREFAQALSSELKRRAELLGPQDFTTWHTDRPGGPDGLAEGGGPGAGGTQPTGRSVSGGPVIGAQATGSGSTGRSATGAHTPGRPATGGTESGGRTTGAQPIGGQPSGRSDSGGHTTGQSATGRPNTQRPATGGHTTGGSNTGGHTTGRPAVGGTESDGRNPGHPNTERPATGGRATGGHTTGTESGGRTTGQPNTENQATGGHATGGPGPGGHATHRSGTDPHTPARSATGGPGRGGGSGSYAASGDRGARVVAPRAPGDVDPPSGDTSRTLNLRAQREQYGPHGQRQAAPGALAGYRPLPRLVVLVDDYDALVAPALGSPGRPAAGSVVRALEAVARDGARLGVHLVAASGRPERTAETAVVERAGLRVSLESLPLALDAAEPPDASGTPSGPTAPATPTVTTAASATAASPGEHTPGRGRLFGPGGGLATPFQAGRVTGRIPRTATQRPTVVPLEWERMGDPPTRRPLRELGNGPTDLALLASALQRAAQSADASTAPALI
ncbi:FHA domain-containing protein [Streptomyces sp. NA02950]|uniref:FHA domain-containing protein n=1 Tax=Streptomyces sp. NA02950 TaxID=2742137 RepID=UPI00158FBB72|nr:FHA domain-containing protein [Streptomyces sp. NA02950]QKV94646.1 FHA domain-containing protein [Streptomyces sp. NA02950]